MTVPAPARAWTTSLAHRSLWIPTPLAGRLAPRIAVLIPCYNEAATIATVVADFCKALPSATVYVYDNNSTDDTRRLVAAAAGAIVRTEPLQGKGNVVRRMFADIEADAYVLVDGDGTYDAASATRMVELLLRDSLDMVNGARVATTGNAYRPGHAFGNKLLTGTVAFIFGNRIRDMLSGYRVLSRRFVKSFPALSTGFETETELTVHALELRLPIVEVDTPYRDRPAGSRASCARSATASASSNDRATRERGTAAAILLERRRALGLDVRDPGVAAADELPRNGPRAPVSRRQSCRPGSCFSRS